MLRQLGYGFRIQETWKLSLAAVTGMSLVIGVQALEHFWHTSGGPVRTIIIPGEHAVVKGLEFDVPFDGVKRRATCSGDRPNQRAVHYKDGHGPDAAEPIIDGYMPILGARIPDVPGSRAVFPVFLTLPRPLPKIPGGSWYYQESVLGNCTLMERLFGSSSLSETPPIPVKVEPQ